MTYGIEMSVYAPRAGVYTQDSPKSNLYRAKNRSFIDQLNDPGGGEFSLPFNDADVAHVSPGDIVICKLNGNSATSWIVEEIKRGRIKIGEEPQEVRTYKGRGRAAYFERARVYPEGGLNRRFGTTRNFDFTSMSYWLGGTPAGWQTAAISQDGRVSGGPGPEWPWFGKPWGSEPVTPFADFNRTKWIWYSSRWWGKDVWLSKQFTVSASALNDSNGVPYNGPGEYAIWSTADDAYELVIDGKSIVSESTVDDPYLFEDVRRTNVYLDAGPHVIAVHGWNNPQPVDVGGFWMEMRKTHTVREDTDDTGYSRAGASTGPIVRTDSSWLANWGPQLPGMTPGKIFRILMDEARARGCFQGKYAFTLLFTDTHDSAGNPWPLLNMSLAVGTDYLSVLQKFSEIGISWNVSPWQNSLQLFSGDGLGEFRDVRYKEGETVTGIDDTSTYVDIANTILVQVDDQSPTKEGAEGKIPDHFWIEQHNSSSVTQYGRREEFLSAGDQGPTFSRLLASSLLADRSVPAVAVSLSVLNAENQSIQPWMNYHVGDTIWVPAITGTFYGSAEVPIRVLAISVAEDEFGIVTVNPEVGTILSQQQERLHHWLNAMVPGSLGGTAFNASLPTLR